ncbi:hypothetical protein F6X40_09525 [Paraburkholderia sp. UCT31]|uniref:hypothetical protein n=1 Tax=Paraburkholderia sp. UCT31 TaxID=2615209 RepID=UPI00165575D2|nr:hypothetical protein [Paraburkholderia sp. UCT31]MBC8737048.1 hypothetical protein [Paraburkholderia sp. UCT31]
MLKIAFCITALMAAPVAFASGPNPLNPRTESAEPGVVLEGPCPSGSVMIAMRYEDDLDKIPVQSFAAQPHVQRCLKADEKLNVKPHARVRLGRDASGEFPVLRLERSPS